MRGHRRRADGTGPFWSELHGERVGSVGKDARISYTLSRVLTRTGSALRESRSQGVLQRGSGVPDELRQGAGVLVEEFALLDGQIGGGEELRPELGNPCGQKGLEVLLLGDVLKRDRPAGELGGDIGLDFSRVVAE